MKQKHILAFSDSLEDIDKFTQGHKLTLYTVEQLSPMEYNYSYFNDLFLKLESQFDLSLVDLVIAEYVEALPLVYFMRKKGYVVPTIFIPHTNPYPIDLLLFFILATHFRHTEDIILCGSENAAQSYQSILGVKSLPICTFGIFQDYCQKLDKEKARHSMGLPENKKIVLCTARFMNDKGWEILCKINEKISKIRDDILFVGTSSHIDSDYYNSLAISMKNIVFYYRLSKNDLANLYRASDLFICPATSCFETYGKSPLEAIASGLRVVLPKWDGFQYYITEDVGSLVQVNYLESSHANPFQFAVADVDDYVQKIINEINNKNNVPSIMPDWAMYDKNMALYQKLIDEKILSKKQTYDIKTHKLLNTSLFSPSVIEILKQYSLRTIQDLESFFIKGPLIGREEIGSVELLKNLHNDIFKVMDKTNSKLKWKTPNHSKDHWLPKKYIEGSSKQFHLGCQWISSLKSDKHYKNILDIGCGPGTLTNQLALKYPSANIIGLDSSANMIEYAQKYSCINNQTKINFRLGNALEPMNNTSFDLVVSFWALSWVDNPAQLLKSILKQTHKNSDIFIQIPLNNELLEQAISQAFHNLGFNTHISFPKNTNSLEKFERALFEEDITFWKIIYTSPDYTFLSVEDVASYVQGWFPYIQSLNIEENKKLVLEIASMCLKLNRSSDPLKFTFPSLFIVNQDSSFINDRSS